MGQSGTVDFDVWPTTISWAGDRYKVEFVSSARTNDTQYDFPAYTVGGPVRETRRLDAIKVWSNPEGSWQLVRQYSLSYDYSLYSDERVCLNAPTCTGWGPNTGYPKLTLKSIQRIGAYDGSPATLPALPATTFSYGTSGGSAFDATGGWNRLTGMSNGQGGTLSIQYENMAAAIAGDDHYRNRHRVTSKTATDGQGNSYPWTYSYGTPLVNTIGSTLGDGIAGVATPTSATLYYNVFLDGDADYSDEPWLVHHVWTEFLGHSWMTETAPDGAKVKHSFYQGNPSCQPAAGAVGSHAAITGDSCFQSMLKQEFLKGREYLTEEQTSAGLTLHATAHEFQLGPVDYTWAPLAGLWRAFSAESATEDRQLEGGSTSSTQRTVYSYDLTNNTNKNGLVYGNRSRADTYNNGVLQRITMYFYTGVVTADDYLVDRVRVTAHWDSSWRTLAFTARFYDGTATDGGIGSCGSSTCGLLTRESALYDIPPQSNLVGLTLHSRDTTYGYDSYGNQTSASTYTGAGTAILTGSTWGYSAPGSGSSARTTTTSYDPSYHALPTSHTNPLSQSETAVYDYRMGTLSSVTDANSATTSASYDVFGRLATLVKPGDSATFPTLTASYADTALPFRYTYQQREQAGTGNVRSTRVYYDGMGRQIETKVESKDVAPYQSIATFQRYDGLGHVTQQSQPTYVSEADQAAFDGYTNPAGVSGVSWTTSSYDALGRVSTVTDPTGGRTAHFYGVESSSLLRWHDVVDANHHRVQERFDSLGRRVRVDEIGGNCGGFPGYACASPYTVPWAGALMTSYTYTSLDLLDTVSDANGNLTDLDYDSLGRKTRSVDPDMGTWSYRYDANGNLAQQNDAKNQTTCFWYDALQRPTGRLAQSSTSCPASQPASPDASFSYDQGTYGKGRRTAMATGSTTSSTWSYDARGRLSSSSDTVVGLPTARSFSWTYDSADRVETIGYPSIAGSSETVSYSYDAAWRQRSVCGTTCYVSNASATALGQPASWSFFNGIQQTWDYNQLGQLSQLRIGTSGNLSSIFDRSYSYDGVGNLSLLSDTKTNQPQAFGYDEQNRLLSASAITQTIPAGTVVTVHAMGTPANGWPIMELRVNGATVASWTVNSTSWVDYTYTLTSALSPRDTIDIVFTNDYSDGVNYSGARKLHSQEGQGSVE